MIYSGHLNNPKREQLSSIPFCNFKKGKNPSSCKLGWVESYEEENI